MTNYILQRKFDDLKSLIPDDVKHREAHALYWQDRAKAFAIIQELKRLADEARSAPMYIGGGYYTDEDGDVTQDVYENLGPYDRWGDFSNECTKNRTVMEIIKAKGLYDLLA